MSQEDVDAFVKFAQEQSEIHKKNIDGELYNFLIDCAENLSQLEDSQTKEMAQILEKVRENAIELKDLDKITEIYFYEGQYATTSREIQQTILYLTTIYAEKFEKNNLEKLEHVLINDKDFKGDLALEFYLKIGLIDDKKNSVLTFIKNNFDSLTENQKQQCLYTLAEYDPNPTISEILVKSGLFEYKNNRKKAWWKFW